jgi:glycine betaine/proline transport system substrate-binding protein
VAFFKKFRWKPEEIGKVMLDVENGAKPAAAADSWVKRQRRQGKRVDALTVI